MSLVMVWQVRKKKVKNDLRRDGVNISTDNFKSIVAVGQDLCIVTVRKRLCARCLVYPRGVFVSLVID